MKILCFDVETNGLLGHAFAVGGCLVDSDTGKIESTFEGCAPLLGEPIQFVADYVIPKVSGLPKYETSALLRHAFWKWYKEHDNGSIIYADFGYPVETNFLRLCQEDTGQVWAGAFPLHEVATLLLAKDLDPDLERADYASGLIPDSFSHIGAHNPLFDAIASAYTVIRAIKE